MRRIATLLAHCGESHQTPTNTRIHWLCVPIMFISVMAFFTLPPPLFGVSWLWIAAIAVSGWPGSNDKAPREVPARPWACLVGPAGIRRR